MSFSHSRCRVHRCCVTRRPLTVADCVAARRAYKEPSFFLLRTALKDRPQGPSTANRQPLPTATNRQPPTTNHHQPTATNSHQPPPTANHQSPPTMVGHMSYTRSFCKNCSFGALPPPLRTALVAARQGAQYWVCKHSVSNRKAQKSMEHVPLTSFHNLAWVTSDSGGHLPIKAQAADVHRGWLWSQGGGCPAHQFRGPSLQDTPRRRDRLPRHWASVVAVLPCRYYRHERQHRSRAPAV